MTGTDPYFHLLEGLQKPLRPGMYRLAIVFPSPPNIKDPKLFIDTGQGYSDKDAVPMRLSDDGTLLSGIFNLQAPAAGLRLDPSCSPGEICIKRVRLRRVSTSAWRIGRVLRAVRGRIRSPEQLLRVARRAIALYRDGGWSILRQAIARAAVLHDPGKMRSYEDWIRLYDTITSEQLDTMRADAESLAHKPLISVLMPVYNTPETLLCKAIDSVIAQIYSNWELCIADDASTKPHVRQILRRYAEREPRIRLALRETNGHISHASNSALELVRGEWIALLDHDDVLRPHALFEVVSEINRHPEAELIYSDEDKLDERGRRFDPFFKPDFSLEMFRSQNYLNHLTVHRTASVRAVGGWRAGFEGGQDYDLNLRVIERMPIGHIRHIPMVLYHWRAVSGSTAAATSQKSYAWEAGRRALESHLGRTGLAGSVEEIPGTPFYRLRLPAPAAPPLVSLVIPTRDGLKFLRGCIESIREKTAYDSYEIIVVDNGSSDPETLAYLEAVSQGKQARVLRCDVPFNFSAINNFAIRQARGSVIGLINNDIEVIGPDWLTEMVNWAVRPEIGCVGAKLLYADGKIQHGGVVVGLGGVAGHSHKYFGRHEPGYFFRMQVISNVSAVTAACLVVRREVYEQVGGLNETALAIAFNDVDFCLKVRDAGYRNVWTPFAELYHLESVSRGAEDNPTKLARFNREIAYMQQRWGEALQNDPFYSPNLTIDREDFSLAFPPRQK